MRVATCQLERHASLARAAGAREDDQPDGVFIEELADLPQFAFASHERTRRRWKRCSSEAGRNRCKRRVVVEDPSLQVGERGTRREPQLSIERCPQPGEALQRLRVTAGSVQAEHRLSLQPFAERVAIGQRAYLADQIMIPAEGELRVDAILLGEEPPLIEPRRLHRRSGEITEAAEGRPPPQRQRTAQQRRGERRVALLQRAVALVGSALEPG